MAELNSQKLATTFCQNQETTPCGIQIDIVHLAHKTALAEAKTIQMG